jgi:ATP-dependent Clp protease ATP-binding subunit ClpC
MFERYTLWARRTLFFARYEASLLGSTSIENEHLLLGLLREKKGLTTWIFADAHVSFENIRKDIERRTVVREKVPTSVEIPFSAETKRALQCAADEADRMLHNYIGTEHLLLGLLHEGSSLAGSILHNNGFELEGLRNQIAALLQTSSGAEPADHAPSAAELERAKSDNVAEELERVKSLIDRLAHQLSDQEAANSLIEQIWSQLERLQERFRR